MILKKCDVCDYIAQDDTECFNLLIIHDYINYENGNESVHIDICRECNIKIKEFIKYLKK